MKNAYILGIGALMTVGIFAAMGILFANEAVNSTDQSQQNWSASHMRHPPMDRGLNRTLEDWQVQAMNAVSNNSFDAWKSAMIGGLTVERFNSLVQRHQSKSDQNAKVQAVQTALVAGDYEAWKNAVSALGSKNNVTSMVTQDEFNTIVQIYKAKESGNFSQARSLMEESGLNMIPGMECGMGYGHGMRGGRPDNRESLGLGLGMGPEW
ncbi:MAG: hypothetical protein NTW67_04985 [Candidatus Woesearchaeota archaeon]|nr:hypothetical protein [Candidatus Woesearchaeota archaeon]